MVKFNSFILFSWPHNVKKIFSYLSNVEIEPCRELLLLK